MNDKYLPIKSRGIAYNGYAFADESVKKLHDEAWQAVQHIDRAVAVERSQSLYGRNRYVLNAEATKGLADFEKLVLANGGPIPFGGALSSPNVAEVYND